jgi:DNA mismatch repair ATPase MutS
MFFDDAVRGAALLGLTLTSRNKSDPDPIPMCGIPWHQRDGYVARLLRLGHKVAICDQLVEPDGRTLVERGVTEVLTPGSVTAEAFLDAAANNELVALWPGDTRLGVCVTDASTGEVRLAEPTWEDVPALLGRIRAAEWLLPEERGDDSRLAAALRGLAGARTMLPAERFLGAPDARGRWPERVRDLGDLEAAWVAASIISCACRAAPHASSRVSSAGATTTHSATTPQPRGISSCSIRNQAGRRTTRCGICSTAP